MASLPGEPGQVPTRRRGSRLTSVSAGPVVPRPPAETPSRQQFGAGRPWPARRRGGDSETSAARAARGALPPGSGPAPPGAARRPRRPTPRAEGPLTAVALGLAGGGGRSAPQRPASLRGPASGRRPDTCADSGLRARSPPRPPSPGGVPAAPATPDPSPAPSSRGSTAPVAMARIRGGRTRKRAAGGTHARTHARTHAGRGPAARPHERLLLPPGPAPPPPQRRPQTRRCHCAAAAASSGSPARPAGRPESERAVPREPYPGPARAEPQGGRGVQGPWSGRARGLEARLPAPSPVPASSPPPCTGPGGRGAPRSPGVPAGQGGRAPVRPVVTAICGLEGLHQVSPVCCPALDAAYRRVCRRSAGVTAQPCPRGERRVPAAERPRSTEPH